MFYLKYRPNTISQIDNSRVKENLSKILNSETVPHAILLVGEKGTGKTSTARIFAKAINCLKNKFSGHGSDFEPCNQCLNCQSITSGSFTDVIEMDAASNRGIEEIKNLIKETSFMPMSGLMRVFIIDEAHMITTDGFNALLKTLEEPPSSAIFILATTNIEKLPQTIISRCIKVNFGKAKLEDILLMLKRISQSEKLSLDDKVLKLIAKHSDFSFRDAAKILQEITTQKIFAFEEVEKYFGVRGKDNLLEIISINDSKKSFEWIEEFVNSGGNIKNLIEDMLRTLRLLLLKKKGVKIEDEIEINLETSQIIKLIKLLMESYSLLKSSPIESLPLEIALSEFYNESTKK